MTKDAPVKFFNTAPLSPTSFFSVTFPLYPVQRRQLTKRHRLPNLEDVQGKKGFAEVYLGWHEQGLAVRVSFSHLENSFYPNIRAGECLELMIDTRDVKQASMTHRYCHHFFFLPKAVEEVQAGEITHFRTEDAHPPCDPALLEVSVKKKEMEIWIPKEVLVGYEPASFPRLGLAYRVSRCEGEPQELPLSSEDVALEKHPGRWASCEFFFEN